MTLPEISTPSTGVDLLMGVRNGAAFLPGQLESIASQTFSNWRVVFSDDGSTDGTRSILDQFLQEHPGKVIVREGPQQGFSANFMQLIRDLPGTPGHVGFADQDDIWMTDKLSRGITALDDGDEGPKLYAARSFYWQPAMDQRQPSPPILKPCCFRNALIENVASGNTILLNPAAARLAREAARRTDRVFAHDWWLYLLVSGAGGRIIFDNGPPCLLYRQHGGNVIGAGNSLPQQVRRKLAVLRGAFSDRLQSNIKALDEVRDLLTDENRRILDDFAEARTASMLPRLVGLRRIRPYRQSLLGNIGFWGAASLGRI
ncbi:hypothetical protein BOO69_17705 [Sulfitobacter alexandrii]|uniref:Glycosyltransferase 2-like domain-containing protein n=1 Tax=Sulfitobacter alexandrii TaxID=1917485 RepID=A0A1J0WL03_9RHOB|nr:glycosyltransferase [Sulfitobacter alexandrii]APE45041.1 hypothetical protein BOO69_17705 [Sulfitobacter alexandrii]